MNTGKYEAKSEMAAYFQSAIKEAELAGDGARQSALHNQFAQALISYAQFEAGNQQLDRAIHLAQEMGDKQLEAFHLGTRGTMLLVENKMDEGYECFQAAKGIANEIGDYGLESDAIGSMAIVQLETGDPAQAITYFKEALKIAAYHDDSKRSMKFYSGLGNTYLTIAANDEAEKHFQKALQLAESIGDRESKVGLINNIATIEKNKKNFERATKLFEQVRDLANENGDALGERNSIRHLIDIYSSTNQKSDMVLLLINRAISLSKQLGQYNEEASYEDARILVLLNLNRQEEALELIDRALQDDRLSQIPDRKMQLLVNRGNTLYGLSKFDQAFQTYQQALRSAVRRQNKRVEARILGRLGAVEAERSQLESAIYYAEESIQKAGELDEVILLGEQYCMRALAYRDLGKLPEAIDSCEEAVSILEDQGSNSIKQKALFLLDELKAKKGLDK